MEDEIRWRSIEISSWTEMRIRADLSATASYVLLVACKNLTPDYVGIGDSWVLFRGEQHMLRVQLDMNGNIRGLTAQGALHTALVCLGPLLPFEFSFQNGIFDDANYNSAHTVRA